MEFGDAGLGGLPLVCRPGRTSSRKKRFGPSFSSCTIRPGGSRGRGRRVRRLGMISALLALTIFVAQDTTAGRAVYTKWCAGCHGDNGAGDGEAARYMLPHPRDFTGAIYQIRSTASGALPTDA